MEDMLTTKEAAEYLDVSMARIRQLIGAAQVCAQRNGKSWLVERASLDAYAATATPGPFFARSILAAAQRVQFELGRCELSSEIASTWAL